MEAQALGPSPHAALKHARAQALQAAAQAWVAELLGVTTPQGLADPLLLGRVAEALQAALRGQRGEIAAHRVPPLQPSARGRITGYARWQQVCRELGVGADQVPALADVEEGRGGLAVCACVWAAAERAAAMGLPVPSFGGADWRASMPRELAIKRAELFEGSGDSPPKLPALNKLLTPRAYACKPDSPASGGSVPALRDSNTSLREWLHGGGSSQKGTSPAGAAEERQEQQAASGLGSTVAALEAAAAEAAQAARQLKQHQDRAQALRRPSLPPLDVAAAAAVAAAEAAEQDSAAREAYAPSPLSSPGSIYGSPGPAGYASSSTYVSSASSPALSSPARYRLTPTRLQQSSLANPLFDQLAASPHCPPGSQTGAVPAGPGAAQPRAEVITSPAAAAESGTCGSGRRSATAGAQPLSGLLQRSPVRHLEREESEEEAGEEAAYLRGSIGGGGDLLESLLSPPHMKPVHTQLLGALMHTRTAGYAAKPAAQPAAKQWVQQRGEESEEEESAVPAAPAAADAGVESAPAEPAAQQPSQAEPAAEPAAAPQPAVESSDAAHSGRRGGGLRKFTLLLLGAAAGAAAAVLAQQQGGSGRSKASGQPRRQEKGSKQEKGGSRTADQHLALTRG
ncbi:hypothetical protein C2E21_3345 [Chlorella sorokiniana]|uniref:Uncharacterized protein n=1 Tax=Chlorella sorokiniana TaxID=3076 RepID=A0A2P6TU64_CHLSO|nr:hypothetical protein C2E21_3345 [Chlorella sorokiniana]|eukprot:PRW57599.1 hypothetical protein C2E21_3345 [Chlorella sorokiniana]